MEDLYHMTSFCPSTSYDVTNILIAFVGG